MRTSKAFSTISYNSHGFLERKLNDLVHRGDLQFWAFIHHHAEDEERSDHNHVFFLPDKLIDTFGIKPEFDELRDDGSIDGCKLFRPSNWGDWYLYALHDPAYLASKYELEKPKKFMYLPENVVCSDDDIRQSLVEQMNYTELMSPSFKLIREHATAGISLIDFLQRFPVKKSELRYVKEIYELYGGKIYENAAGLHEA